MAERTRDDQRCEALRQALAEAKAREHPEPTELERIEQQLRDAGCAEEPVGVEHDPYHHGRRPEGERP